MTATDAGEIGRSGWRQGSVVRDDLAAKLRAESLLPPDIPEGAVFVVISHGCDLTNDSFEKEPQIELLVVRPATKQALRLQGRDPRCLQIPIEGAPDGSLLEARAHGRFFLDRQVLLGHSPHAEMRLGDQSRRRLADWLAKRYSRAAFPDEFNRRLQPAQEEIKKLFRQQGDPISELFLTLEDTELPEEETYGVLVWAVMREADYRRDPVRAEAQGSFDRLLALLNGCKGISADGELRSDADLTLHEIRAAKRWDAWDWLSPAEDG